MNYADLIFNKNTSFNSNLLFYGAFISIDNTSSLKEKFLDILSMVKKYDNYEIIIKRHKELDESYSENNYIIKTLDNIYFLRIIMMDDLIYDVLIYSNINVEKIKKIFFSDNESKIPDDLLKIECENYLILEIINEKYIIKKASKSFYKLIKYEDWDYKNKYQNVLNFIIKEFNKDKLIINAHDNTLLTLNYKSYISGNFILIKY